jgi:hypothetical protein
MSNQSINNLVGTFTAEGIGNSYQLNNNDVICIDTSNNRLGIDTLEPEHAIDVSNNGTIKCGKLILTGLIQSEDGSEPTISSGQIYYNSNNVLKYKP